MIWLKDRRRKNIVLLKSTWYPGKGNNYNTLTPPLFECGIRPWRIVLRINTWYISLPEANTYIGKWAGTWAKFYVKVYPWFNVNLRKIHDRRQKKAWAWCLVRKYIRFLILFIPRSSDCKIFYRGFSEISIQVSAAFLMAALHKKSAHAHNVIFGF